MDRQNRSTKMLSMQRPRPSILIAIWRPANSPVNCSEVNCEPWSLLKMSGRPRRKARFSASTQNFTYIVNDSDQLSTNRLNQSMTATRYKKPCAIRIYVISVLHTWLTRSIVVPLNKYG